MSRNDVDFLVGKILENEEDNIENEIIQLTKALYENIGSNQSQITKTFDKLLLNTSLRHNFYEDSIGNKEIMLFLPPGVPSPLPFTHRLTKETVLALDCQHQSILDVGCGCGLTQIACAKLNTSAFGIDISNLSIMSSKLNSIYNSVDNNSFSFHADFNTFNPNLHFDLIVSNPPTHKNIGSKQVYGTLIEGNSEMETAEYAIRHTIDIENISLFERIIQRAPSLLSNNGKVIISNGNMSSDNLKSMEKVMEQYGVKDKSIKTYILGYNKFQFCDEDYIKNAIFFGAEVYSDTNGKNRIMDSKEVISRDYFFKGFTITISKSQFSR